MDKFEHEFRQKKNGLGYILGDFSQTHPVTLMALSWQ
jgi:hypothetical protein